MKIVGIKTGDLKDQILVPGSQAGYQVQEHLTKQGWTMNHGVGPDLKDVGIEIKTRKKSSKSPHSIGSMTIENIIRSSYKDSNIFEKFQKQLRVVYDDYGRVLSDKVIDFSDPIIQKEMSKSWDLNKIELEKYSGFDSKKLPKYIKHKNAKFQWEHKEGRSYVARLPNHVQKSFEETANTNKARSQLFE